MRKKKRTQATDNSRAHTHCMPKATGTHSKYVIGLLIALLWQQWLREHASVLHYAYIVCLVIICVLVIIAYKCGFGPFNTVCWAVGGTLLV